MADIPRLGRLSISFTEVGKAVYGAESAVGVVVIRVETGSVRDVLEQRA